jgi:hypothetical protein
MKHDNLVKDRCYMSRLLHSLFTLTISLGCVAMPQAALAQDEIDEEARSCISSRTIRKTAIVDDRTIIFYSSHDKAYLNTLPRACHGLKREDRFSYRSSVGQICDLDSIRVLSDFGGRLQEGIACGLGKFIPMSHEDADALRDPRPRDAEPAEIPVPEPEDMGGEPEASEPS